jgi:hypothetical protein
MVAHWDPHRGVANLVDSLFTGATTMDGLEHHFRREAKAFLDCLPVRQLGHGGIRADRERLANAFG